LNRIIDIYIIIIFVFLNGLSGVQPCHDGDALDFSGAIMQQTPYYGNKSFQMLHNTLQNY